MGRSSGRDRTAPTAATTSPKEPAGRPRKRPEEELFLAVLRAAAALNRRGDLFFREFDITQGQYNVLRILRGAGPAGLCRNEISRRMINATPDMSRMLERMESAGLLARERSAEDRRNVSTVILPAGLALLERIDGPLRAMQAEMLGWPIEEQRVAHALMERIRLAAEDGASPK